MRRIKEKNFLPSGIKCCIEVCKKSRRNAEGLKMFKFPSADKILGKIWREKCKIPEEDYEKNLYICENHFSSSQHGRKRLKAEAIPTEHLGKTEDESEDIGLKLRNSTKIVHRKDEAGTSCQNCKRHKQQTSLYRRKYDASKRKWKNLRDSYTKYLRSFRVGTKTAKKYQFWAHAEHMDFLKPFQGVGRSTANITAVKDEDDNECDLGYQVLAKATANINDVETKANPVINSAAINLPITSTAFTSMISSFAAGGMNTTTSSIGLTIPTVSGITGSSTNTGPIMLPVPSLPTVQLPPSLTAKPILGDLHTTTPFPLSTSSTSSGSLTSSSSTYTTPSLASLPSTTLASQVFTLPQLSAKGPILMPSSNTASSVGCLIIEPQLFASADTFRKEFGSGSAITPSSNAQITSSSLQIYPNLNGGPSTNTTQAINNRMNQTLITKIRRVQPSPQASAINLSIPATLSTATTTTSTLLSSYKANGSFNTNSTNFLPTLGGSTTITAAPCNSNGISVPPPIKKPKTTAEVDIAAILQANRDLDANTLFFLSLARSVRNMPTKFQNLAKMRCMRIVSDIEMELDNVDDDGHDANTKYCTSNSDSPPPSLGNNLNEAQSEHFVYVMSPSRVESMIDLSSDEENAHNNGT